MFKDWENFKKRIEKTEETEGLEYDIAVLWLNPDRLPLGVVSLNGCQDSIIKIPKYHVNYWGRGVPVIRVLGGVLGEDENLTDLILPSTIAALSGNLLKGCGKLERMTFPKNVKYVGEGAFRDCVSLKDVYYEGSEDEWKDVEIVHCGADVVDEKKLGLYCDIKTYDIPGNEPLLNARIHFNCSLGDYKANEGQCSIRVGNSDITDMFRTIV